MPPQRDAPTRVRTRVSNACQRCRRHKIKCSGSFPCKSCSNKHILCEIGLESRYMLNSMGNTRRDQSQRRQESQSQSSTESGPTGLDDSTILMPANGAYTYHDDLATVSAIPSDEAVNEGSSEHLVMDHTVRESDAADQQGSDTLKMPNPMVPEQPVYMQDGFGNPRYLGHSSTFSFSRQLLSWVHQHPAFREATPTHLSFDAESYAVDATPMHIPADDFAGLPSLEVACFYLQVLKFKTTPFFYLFDEISFTMQLQKFYDNPAVAPRTDRTWYVHYLLIMAFGKALSTQSPSGNIAGVELFNRALRLLPDATILWANPLIATEILCCIGLYLYSIDHRSAGYIYIGQALRLAHIEGLHTNIQDELVGYNYARRGRQIWRTVYSLDRRISTSIGLPNSLREEDITAPFPSASNTSVNSHAQALHMNLCRLLGKIIHIVYSADGTLDRTFLTRSQEVLRDIGGLADDLTAFSQLCLGEVSRVVAHLNLVYHQCIIICTRPVLLHLVKLRLKSADPTAPQPMSTPCKGVVQACVDSATRITVILSELRQHHLLDTFLPFDLESCYSAALVLAMTKGIHPKLLPLGDWIGDLMLTMDHMIQKGNVMASVRKREIQELVRVRWNGPVRDHNASGVNHASTGLSQASPSSSSLPTLGDAFFDQWGTHEGLSGAQIVSLADALSFTTETDFFQL